MFKSNFTDAEWQTVLFTPLWAFGAVSTVDGMADERESAVLAKELTEAMLYKDELTREVFGALMGSLGTIGAAFTADHRPHLQGLQEAALVLDAKLPGGGADKFKLAVLGICVNAAKASGPRFRDKVSKEEKAAIVLVATVLRVPVPVG
jgi:hypothetical protein